MELIFFLLSLSILLDYPQVGSSRAAPGPNRLAARGTGRRRGRADTPCRTAHEGILYLMCIMSPGNRNIWRIGSLQSCISTRAAEVICVMVG
jgi:hypothetical protein